MTTVTVSELEKNLIKYIALASEQDIYIINDGKNVAKLTNSVAEKLKILDKLSGIISQDIDVEAVRLERLSRQ